MLSKTAKLDRQIVRARTALKELNFKKKELLRKQKEKKTVSSKSSNWPRQEKPSTRLPEQCELSTPHWLAQMLPGEYSLCVRKRHCGLPMSRSVAGLLDLDRAQTKAASHEMRNANG